MNSKSFVFVSFATKGDVHYRDYSHRIETVLNVMNSFEAEFLLFDQVSLRNLELTQVEQLYLSCRRGVGYWFWKPVILLNLVERFPNSFIVYFDIDVEILSMPKSRVVEIVSNSDSGFGAYLTNSKLLHWTKRSMVRKLGLKGDSKVFEASVLLLDASHEEIVATLQAWRNDMQHPSNLLDDLLDFDGRHRHDQTILSIAESTGRIEIQDIGSDFWIKPEGLVTGNRNIGKWLRNYQSVFFHKFQLLLFLIRFKYHFKNQRQEF